jgi:AraC family transcriptional regulator
MPVVRTVQLPFLRVEYDRSSPDLRRTAVTRSGSVGVAFTAQRRASWLLGGRRREGVFPAGVSMPGECDLMWNRWSDVSEAVEYWIDEAWIERLSGVRQALRRREPRACFNDPVLIAVAAQFRRNMASNTIDKLRFEELALAATHRIIGRKRRASSNIAPLDDRRLRSIASAVDSSLSQNISLEMLANVAGIGIFHFAKRFRAATGVSPYAYVVGCRMTRAMQLLRRGMSVDTTAHTVGYSQIGHFRRQFLAHWGQLPGRLAN